MGEDTPLTPDERAALKRFMDKETADATAAEQAAANQKVAEEQAAADAKKAADELADKAAKEAEYTERRKAEPHQHFGLEVGPGQHAYQEHPGPTKERSYRLHGQNWEHTHEDADGCWIYRQKP